MQMLDRLLARLRVLLCQHPRRQARMRWVEEFVDYYEECIDCGREFYGD